MDSVQQSFPQDQGVTRVERSPGATRGIELRNRERNFSLSYTRENKQKRQKSKCDMLHAASIYT